MRKPLHVLAVFAVLMMGGLVPPAMAQEDELAIEAEATDESVEGQKLDLDDSAELETTPDPNELTDVDPDLEAEAVHRTGCIFRPGGRVTINLRARGRVLYRVVPDRFFDVTMQVSYRGLRSFFVDRFHDGGAESILVRGPNRSWPVKVTIRGFRGDTGCFAFSATP
jgi:hypothetical protein